MTGGGDNGDLEETKIAPDTQTELESRNESDEDGAGIAPIAADLDLNLSDTDPTAGGSDIGGRAGDD